MTREIVRAAFFLALAAIAFRIFACSNARAITSIDIPERTLEEKGRALVSTISFSNHSGNGTALSLTGSLGGAITSHKGRNLYLLKTSGAYSEFEDAVTGSNAFVHLRHQYRIRPWLLTDVFVQAQQDRFRRLKSRTLEGAGPSFLLVKAGSTVLRAGTGVMHELERYRSGPGPAESKGFRSTSYVSLKSELAARVTGSVIAYLQPMIDDFGDVRLLQEASLKFGISSWLSVNLGCVVAHDSDPPAGVKKTDVDIASGLGITL